LKSAQSRHTFEGYLNSLPNQRGQVYVSQEEGALQNFVGTVLSVENQEAIIEIRNNLKLGETLEVFSPELTGTVFVLTTLIDDQNQNHTIANKPMAKMRINVPTQVQAGDFIRRKGTL